MTNSLVIFTKASILLAEADTIQKTKELKSLALTAAEWAKRKDMGKDAILYCRSYALEAERKMGQMLAETERAKAGRPPKLVTAGNQLSEPTLDELGLTKRESSEAQIVDNCPTFAGLGSGNSGRCNIGSPSPFRVRASQKWGVLFFYGSNF
jgi:hypothetical protein